MSTREGQQETGEHAPRNKDEAGFAQGSDQLSSRESTDDDLQPSEQAQEQALPHQRREKKEKKATKSPSVADNGDLINDVPGQQPVNKATDTVGNAVGSVDGGGGDKPLKLRLDLNLDAEIQLKAKIHGDVTLSLL